MSRSSSGRRAPPRANASTLAKLGPERLAELLVAAAKADAALKRALTLEVAASAEELAAEVDRQLDRRRTAKGRLNAARAAKVARELSALTEVVASRLGGLDPVAAVAGLIAILDLAPVLLERCAGEGRPLVETAALASARLAEVLERVDPAEQVRLVEPLHRLFEAQAEQSADRLMSGATASLAAPARGALRELAQAELEGLSAGCEAGPTHRRLRLTSVLSHLADADGDVDEFLAAQARRPAVLRDHVGGAGRLLTSGRPQEALTLLDGVPLGAATSSPRFVLLRIQVLDALGRREQAQAERWRHFETALSIEALRQHLKRLPDFDDVEREQEALDHALAHADATTALAFLVTWPDLRRAGALVRARRSRLDGSAHEVLGAAAYALAGRDPLAATLVFRTLISWALTGGGPGLQARAAGHLAECSALSGSIADWEEHQDHTAYVIRLRTTYGRRTAFWRIVAKRG